MESIEWKGDIPALAGKKSSPDIFYDDDKKVWVVLGEVDNGTGIFTSKDLKDWIHSDTFDAKLYAPTFHKIILSSSTVSTKYLITNFDGSYTIGDFDGEKFKPISPNMIRVFYGDVYGLKFFRNAPNGRSLAVPFIAQPPSLLRDVCINEITSKMLFDAAIKGDKLANDIFEFTGKVLGEAFCNFIAFSAPEAIILFGGLANAGELLLEPIRKHMNENVVFLWRDKVKVLKSSLPGADAAVLGASALGWAD